MSPQTAAICQALDVETDQDERAKLLALLGKQKDASVMIYGAGEPCGLEVIAPWTTQATFVEETGGMEPQATGPNREYRHRLTFVRVKNATAEKDGTYKRYYLRVPPAFVSMPKNAVAWTFGFHLHGYQPAVET